MGARDLKIKAAAWLDQAKGGAALSQALAENAKLRDELETMKATMTNSHKPSPASPQRRGT